MANIRSVSKEEVKKQSVRAMNRWNELWHENASKNASLYQKLPDIKGSGNGKKAILFAFGGSFQENITGIKDNQLHYDYDIMVVDKALKSTIENGIIPNYCIVADAMVDFNIWGNIDPALCKSIVLLSCITSNYKWAEYWTKNGGKVYFYVNKDGIGTHLDFRQYLPYKDGKSYLIYAGSNVANSGYIFLTTCLEYKNILLGAFDYSFKMSGKYYGNGDVNAIESVWKIGKKSFNNHFTLLDINGDLVQTSENMLFSSKWLGDFIAEIEKTGISTINITGRGILNIRQQAKLIKKGGK